MPCNNCNQQQTSRRVYKFRGTEIVVPNGRELMHYGRVVMRANTKATLDEQQEKLNHCYQCEDATNRVEIPTPDGPVMRTTNWSQCKACACLIQEKVKHNDEACPKGLW